MPKSELVYHARMHIRQRTSRCNSRFFITSWRGNRLPKSPPGHFQIMLHCIRLPSSIMKASISPSTPDKEGEWSIKQNSVFEPARAEAMERKIILISSTQSRTGYQFTSLPIVSSPFRPTPVQQSSRPLTAFQQAKKEKPTTTTDPTSRTRPPPRPH